MTFQQLYYTSCEHGLLGYGGFQFNATTPDMSPAVLRQVEDLTTYEPPRSMPADPRPDQLASYPVAFSYLADDTGARITARVVFAGADYSGRPGNYFAHALVTDSATDFGSILPIELWDAPLWRTTPVRQTELPALPGPPAVGPIDRAGIAKLLADAGPNLMPALLSAVGAAMTGDRPVLLVGKDCATNAAWIAAVCYLLGDDQAGQLSFTTYSHRPTYCPHQIIGVLADSGQALPATSFVICDLASSRLPDVPVHPLGALLASAGVMVAGQLWRQAAALATGAERGFDDWYPLVAAAALLTGTPLGSAEVAAIEDWLAGATRLPQSAGAVLDKLIANHEKSIGDRRIGDLQAAAVRLRSMASAERLELIVVERAYARLQRGEAGGPVVKLSSRSAEIAARDLATSALRTTEDLRQIPAMLRWTSELGVALPAGELRHFGEHFIDPYRDREALADLLAVQPEVLDGFIAMLAAHPDIASELFSETDVIRYEDLNGQPHLMETWGLSVGTGPFSSPYEALRTIRDLRKSTGRRIDVSLLNRLWPGDCPAKDLSKMLRIATEPALRQWFAERLVKALEADGSEGFHDLIAAFERHPEVKDLLPDDQRRNVAAHAKVIAQIKDASVKVRDGDTQVFKALYAAYAKGDRRIRNELGRKVPLLLMQAQRLDIALDRCPPPLRNAYFDLLRNLIQPKNIREDAVEVAANVFAATCKLNERSALWRDLDDALMPVLKWSGGMRKKLRRNLAKADAEAFDQWCEERQGPRPMDRIRGLLFARKDG